MLARSEEERKLDVAFHTVAFHIRVEIVRRIVKRTRPRCVDSHIISFVAGDVRAWQDDGVVVVFLVAQSELPYTRDVDVLLTTEWKDE